MEEAASSSSAGGGAPPSEVHAGQQGATGSSTDASPAVVQFSPFVPGTSVVVIESSPPEDTMPDTEPAMEEWVDAEVPAVPKECQSRWKKSQIFSRTEIQTCSLCQKKCTNLGVRILQQHYVVCLKA